MIYNDSLFEEFLEKDSSCTVHHFNIAWPAIESFKVSNNTGPTLLMTYLQDHHNYNLCSESNFVVPGVGTVHNCQNPIQCYGSLIWNIILDYIKDSKNFRLDLPKLSSLQGNIH